MGGFVKNAQFFPETAMGGGGGGVSDHGALSGLTDDDHTQYSLVDGTRAFTGAITVASDTDVTNVFGRVALHSLVSDHAIFSHFDQRAAADSYALLQSAAGETHINAKNGQELLLNVNGTAKVRVAGTSVRVAQPFSPTTAGGQTLGTDALPWGDTFVSGKIKWDNSSNEQSTVGAAGGASALPATPTKYLMIVDSAGTTLVIPAYAAS